MRITNSMMTRNYLSQLNSLETSVSESLSKVSSGEAISDFSDDTSAAVRAYKIRTTRNRIENYQSNITYATTSLTDSETALDNIEDIYQYALEKIVEAQNSTESEDERSTIATELRSLQEELLSSLNTSASGTYLFGGTTTSTEPFTVDSEGNLAYNGYTLDDLTDTTTSAGVTVVDMLSDDARYVNIGLNMQFDSSGNLIESTAFDYTISGIDIVGYGTTTVTVDGTDITVSNNLYDLLGQIADALESDDYSYDEVDAMYAQFEEAASGILQSLTNVGAKLNYMEFMTNRYDTQDLNLEESQSEVEDIDEATALIEYETNQTAYEAALQMGSSILEYSIFDYMS